MYRIIILAYDGSLESQQALVNCKDLSQWQHARHFGGEEIFVIDGVFEDEHGRYPRGLGCVVRT